MYSITTLLHGPKLIFPLFLTILLTGCTLAQHKVNQTDVAKSIAVQIDVIHQKETDSWLVHYHLSQPVLGLLFNRSTNRFRQQKWKVLGDQLEIKNSEQGEFIQSKSQTTFDQFSLSFKTDNPSLEKDYELFFHFQDSSLLLYSGHFNLRAALNEKQLPDPSIHLTETFTFVPSQNETIYLTGKKYTGSARLTESLEDGTYVFFGNPKPLETNSVIGIFDKGLPQWLKTRADTLLPRLFDYYTKNLGYPLSNKPIVFFSYKPTKTKNSLNFTGNALPGLIQLEVEGQDWAHPSKNGEKLILRFLAHESSHLWIGQLFRGEQNAEWMHEGGAEILAYGILREFGVISNNQYYEYMSDHLNQCINGLNGIALQDSTSKGRFRNLYTCGNIIGLITDHAMKKSHPHSHGVIEFWKTLFDQARMNHNIYSQDMYYSLLLDKTDNPQLVDGIKALINKPQPNPGVHLASLLAMSGLKAQPVTTHFSKEMNRNYGKKILQKLMLCDCGHMSFWEEKNHFLVEGNSKCSTLKDNSIRVDKIGPFSILRNGAKAYEYAFQQSKEHKPISLGLSHTAKTLPITCNDIPERPVFYKLVPSSLF